MHNKGFGWETLGMGKKGSIDIPLSILMKKSMRTYIFKKGIMTHVTWTYVNKFDYMIKPQSDDVRQACPNG